MLQPPPLRQTARLCSLLSGYGVGWCLETELGYFDARRWILRLSPAALTPDFTADFAGRHAREPARLQTANWVVLYFYPGKGFHQRLAPPKHTFPRAAQYQAKP